MTLDLSYVADAVANAIDAVGEAGLLVRLPGRTGTRQELPTRAVLVFNAPVEPTGGVVQAVNQIRISNRDIAAAGWPAPRRGDQIIVAGVTYVIQGVATAAPGGVPAEHFLQIMGQG